MGTFQSTLLQPKEMFLSTLNIQKPKDSQLRDLLKEKIEDQRISWRFQLKQVGSTLIKSELVSSINFWAYQDVDSIELPNHTSKLAKDPLLVHIMRYLLEMSQLYFPILQIEDWLKPKVWKTLKQMELFP